MSLPVFLSEFATAPSSGEVMVIRGAEAKHIQVRRLRVGTQVEITNGRDDLILGTLMHIDSREVHIRIDHSSRSDRPTPHVTVIQALPKSDRAELAVDLMVESGVDCIIPWSARNCVAKWQGKEEKARMKWENASREAAKQARRAWIPPVQKLHSTAEVVAHIHSAVAADGVVGMLHEEETQSFRKFAEQAAKAPTVTFIVGPEGGIAPEEVDQFAAAGALPIVLGPTVLRTALAGSAAINALGPLTQRWQTHRRAAQR